MRERRRFWCFLGYFPWVLGVAGLVGLASCGGGGGGSSTPPVEVVSRPLDLPEGDARCPAGGVLVESGRDSNRNGVLDADEVETSDPICEVVISPEEAALSVWTGSAPNTMVGVVRASASNGEEVLFAEREPRSDLFRVQPDGTVRVAEAAVWDVMGLPPGGFYRHPLALQASALGAPSADFVVFVEERRPLPDGTVTNPFLVSSWAELDAMREQQDAHYLQVADIILSDDVLSDATESSAGFLPIGDCGEDGLCRSDGDPSNGDEMGDHRPFEGHFDGGRFVIQGLRIRQAARQGVGLFGALGSAAVVQNVVLLAVDVEGGDYTGALVGFHEGTLRQNWVSGVVRGGTAVGGVSGRSEGLLVEQVALARVYGREAVGGLVGEDGATSESRRGMFCGTVQGERWVGGLVGHAEGAWRDQLACARVMGTDGVGGLVGLLDGEITDSLSLGEAQGSAGVEGVTGNFSPEVRRVYRLVEAADGVVDYSMAQDAAALRALTCLDAAFEDDAGVRCQEATAGAFPWDFGTASAWPVWRADGQTIEGETANERAAFWDATARRESIDLALGLASAEVVLAAGERDTLTPAAWLVESAAAEEREWTYLWQLPAGLEALSPFGGATQEVLVPAGAASYALLFTRIERDADGAVLAIQAGAVDLRAE